MFLIRTIVFFCCLISSLSWGALPISDDTYKVIQDKFLTSSGALSQEKLKEYKNQLLKLKEQVKANLENYNRSQDASADKSIDLVKESKYLADMDYIINNWLDRPNKINNSLELIEYLSNLLDLENAVKVDNDPTYSETRVLKSLYRFTRNFRISHTNISDYGEAKNLVDPQTGEYLTANEVDQLKANNNDISVLDPPHNNGAIELIEDISLVDPIERISGKNQMHDGVKIYFPKDNAAHFKKLIKTGENAEVILETRDDKGDVTREYVLKLGHEIHSQPTAAALGMTLGIHQDISKHVKNFKVYIGDMKWEDILLELSLQFEFDYINRIVEKSGQDEIGNFVIVKEGLIKARHDVDELNPIGPFYPNLKKGKREIRALMLFNMWIGNADLKPSLNNKIYVKTKAQENELYFIQEDVGFSFGYYGAEKPTEFPWTMVRKKNKKNIIFNFRSFSPDTDLDHITYSDGKWMARKIAQLTREQIRKCVEIGEWPKTAPYNYEQLIIEKLINRRNDLVRAFDLADEILPSGKTIKYMKVNRDIDKEALPTKEYLPNTTVDFRASIKYNYLKPALKTLRGTIVDGLTGISERIDKISIPDTWFGLDHGGVIAQFLIGTTKQIMKNPDPTGAHDKYIVREGFKFGTRAGYGAIFSGFAAYVKEYTLVYPVSDLSKIDEKGKFIVDVTMPYKVMLNFLPEKHILITESYVEGSLRTRIQTPLTGAGNETKVSRINLTRKIISKKEPGIVKYFEDTSKYGQVASKMFLKLAWFRLDQYMATYASGKLHRDVYVLKLDENTTAAIDEAVMNNNPYVIKKNAYQVQEIDSKFIENTSHLNIFGFFQHERTSRTDDFEVLTFNELGEIEKLEHQLEGTYIKRRAWRIITNGEERIARVTMSSRADQYDRLIDPYLALNFEHIDLNTTARELDNAYIPFFNGVANDSNFIQFSARDHSLSTKYGHLILRLSEKIYKEGIERLLVLKQDTFWKELSETLGIDGFNNFKNKFIMYQGRKYNLKRVKRKAQRVWSLIQSAQSKSSLRVRIKSLMKAIIESIPKKGEGQNPIILSAINKIIGAKNFYLAAEIETPETAETMMPGGVTPYNSLGINRVGEDRDLIKIQLGDALKIYNLF